jgi:toluene monooxygenase system protein D
MAARRTNKMSNTGKESYLNNSVGPILRQGPLAAAVAEAAEVDNPGKTIIVVDNLAYVRIQTEEEMIIRRETVEEMLGRPFKMSQLEIDLSSFAGRIEVTNDYARFYFEKRV